MPCVKIALRQKAERAGGMVGCCNTKKGEQTGETDWWSDRKCEPKIVWTKSARGGGDKRLAGETKDGWLDENQFAILALEVRELKG